MMQILLARVVCLQKRTRDVALLTIVGALAARADGAEVPELPDPFLEAYDHGRAVAASGDWYSMKYEKPQKGNPHELTVQQHCFPRKSIARFANPDGVVQVHIVKASKTVFLPPEDSIFCARRTWDERAESGFMKMIEDAYQVLADDIASGNFMRRLSRNERQLVTDMYALWNLRWHWKNRPLDDQKLVGVSGPTPSFSQDERELLKKHHMTSSRTDASLDGRHLTGVRIQLDLSRARKKLADVQWGVIKSRRLEFVVPDNSADRLFFPVTPHLCLANTQGFRIVDDAGVLRMNAESIKASNEYYFAKNLNS